MSLPSSSCPLLPSFFEANYLGRVVHFQRTWTLSFTSQFYPLNALTKNTCELHFVLPNEHFFTFSSVTQDSPCAPYQQLSCLGNAYSYVSHSLSSLWESFQAFAAKGDSSLLEPMQHFTHPSITFPFTLFRI